MRIGAALFAICLVVAGKGIAYAKLGTFAPRLVGFGAKLEVESEYLSTEKETVSVGGQSNKGKSISHLIREELSVGTIGYIYHPNLFTFRFETGGELNQSRLRSNDEVEKYGTGLAEYIFDGRLLPKKPLRATLNLSHNLPVRTGGDRTDAISRTENQLELSYLKKPYSASLYLFHDLTGRIDREPGGLDTERDRVDDGVHSRASYNKRDGLFASLSLDHDVDTEETRHDQAYEKKRTRTNRLLHINRIPYRAFEFRTNFTYQTRDTASDRSKTFNLKERIEGNLPWNFRLFSELGYDRKDIEPVAANGTNSKNVQELIDLVLRHQLFESLRSEAGGKYQTLSSNTGDSKKSAYHLGTNYIKRLRGGSVFGGVSSTVDTIERQGRVSPPSENFTLLSQGIGLGIPLASDPDAYTVQRTDADAATLSVSVSKVGQQNEIQLGRCNDALGSIPYCEDAGEEWSVIKFDAGRPVIRIEKGFGLNILWDPDEDYIFDISYVTVEGDYTVETSSGKVSAGIGIFDNALKADYGFTYTSQELINGDPLAYDIYPEINEHDFRVSYRQLPWQGGIEFKLIDSDYNEKSWLYYLNYQKGLVIFPGVNSNLRLAYDKIDKELYSLNIPKKNATASTAQVSLTSTGAVPLTPLSFYHFISYIIQKGNVPKFQRLSGGLYSLTETNDDDKDTFNTQLQLSMPTNFGGRISVYGRYVAELYARGTNKYTTEYRLNGWWRWNFGQTVFTLSADYEIENIETENPFGTTEHNTDEIEVVLKMTRRLF